MGISISGRFTGALGLVCVATVLGAGAGASQTTPPAFDSIAYHDSGGFAGGGTGKALSIAADGRLEAAGRWDRRAVGTLRPDELAALDRAMAAVDWPHVEHSYRRAGAADLISRDLVVVVRGERYETHVEDLSRPPAPLQDLLDGLDALYARYLAPAPPQRGAGIGMPDDVPQSPKMLIEPPPTVQLNTKSL